MAVLKRIAPFSALKIGFVVYALLGLLPGAACAWMTHQGMVRCPISQMLFHDSFAAVPLFVCPLFFGIVGSVATVLGAVFYNLASEFAGGLEVDIR